MPDVWPSELPQCIPLDNYSEGSANNLLRSQTSTGPAKVRARSTAAVRPVAFTMILSRAQLAVLRSFVEVTLVRGSASFTFPAQTEEGNWLVRFADDGLPQISRIGSKFAVAVKLEILP